MASYPSSLASFSGFSASHTLSADNHAAQHNLEQGEVLATQAKLGTGASTPIAGTVLRGTGTGTTAYGDVVLTTDVTGTLPVANGGTGVTTALALQQQIFGYIYPIGAIYTETTGVNPGTTLGFGTWTAYGAGQVLVGKAGAGTFSSAGSTGGEETHVLTTAELASHTHIQDAHTHIQSAHNHVFSVRDADDAGTDGLIRGTAAVAGTQLADTVAVNQNATATNQNAGSGNAHNNLMPYIVVFIWQRTA